MGDGQTEEAAEPREQPQAQKRARGQNKGRPHMKPNHYDKNKLCPSLVQVSVSVSPERLRGLWSEPLCPPFSFHDVMT